MRDDMSYLLTETYRFDSYSPHKRFLRKNSKINTLEDFESWVDPCLGSVKMKYKTKEFGENLNPLIRFLRKNCGRFWNDVYGDVCLYLNKTKATHLHVIQHLFQYVREMGKGDAVPARMAAPTSSGFRDPFYLRFDTYSLDFYVDNEGILRSCQIENKSGTGRVRLTKNRVKQHNRARKALYEERFKKGISKEEAINDLLNDNKNRQP